MLKKMNEGTGKRFHFSRPHARNHVVSQRSEHDHPLCFSESGLLVAQLLCVLCVLLRHWNLVSWAPWRLLAHLSGLWSLG